MSMTRRAFLASAAAGTLMSQSAAGASATPNTARVVPRKFSPNEKLNIGAIRAGGKGSSDISHSKDENIVALCDVDWDRAAEVFACG